MKEYYTGKTYDGKVVFGYLLQTPMSFYIIPPNQGKENPDLYEVLPDTIQKANGKEV